MKNIENNGKFTLDLTLESEEETGALGERIGDKLNPGFFVTLYGELGAGKSTLARGIFTSFGLTGPFPSPTYLYAVEYPENLVHIDLYMLDDEGFYRLGLDDYFGEPYIAVVEWADKLPDSFKPPGPVVNVTMEIVDVQKRRATIDSSVGI